jgi:hypothetical protein
VRGDPDQTAVRHGIARVDHEIHHHLFELRRVGPHQDRPGGQRELELDALADESAQETVEVDEQRVEVEVARIERLAATESKEFAGDPAGSLRGAQDLGELPGVAMVVAQAMQQELRVAGDRGEKVVEVVSDSAGQLPDRLDLLSLHQLLGEESALGDVEHDSLETIGLALIGRQEDCVVSHPNGATLTGEEAILEGELIALADAAKLLGQGYRGVVRMQARVPEARGGEPFVGSVAQERFDLRTDEEPATLAARRGDVRDGRQLLDEDAEFRLFPRQGLLRAEALLHLLRQRLHRPSRARRSGRRARRPARFPNSSTLRWLEGVRARKARAISPAARDRYPPGGRRHRPRRGGARFASPL